MKLLHTLKILLEQSVEDGSDPWYKAILQSDSLEDILPFLKLFGGDIHEIYRALDKMGNGRDFLDHISSHWDDERQLEHIINVLGGMRNWNNGKVDNDLMDDYVINPYLHDMRYISRNEDGRIILELMPGEEAEFFDDMGHQRSGANCHEVAKQIFGDGLEWDPYGTDMKLEELLDLLTEENYIKLVRYIGVNFQNEEVTAWREEFDSWREEDQLPEGKVFLTLNRMNGFLGGDRYNLAVLIGNTPELENVEQDIKNAYGSAWNEVVQNQYYTEYYKEFEEFLGKPVGEGTTNTYKDVLNRETGITKWTKVEVPVRYFDVTDRARAMIVRHAYEINSPDNFLEMISEFNMDVLCPGVDDYPWDDDEVNDLFQDNLWNYL
tara:strand:+ start:11880 stop:13016 length:1137 start_codon:yes stop_codon:yes gene_type:complete